MDKDIQEMFRQKNREILIHNLELDIERNIDVLEDVLTNIFNNQFDAAIKNISSMYIDEDATKDVTKRLISLKSKAFLSLQEVINKKKEALLSKVEKLEFQEKQMSEYYDFVFKTSEEIEDFFKSEKIDELLQKSISSFEDMNKDCLKEEELWIVNSRIHDYIRYRLFGKLKERVNEEFLIRDNNLANKGKESYEKFQDLESKTCFSN